MAGIMSVILIKPPYGAARGRDIGVTNTGFFHPNAVLFRISFLAVFGKVQTYGFYIFRDAEVA